MHLLRRVLHLVPSTFTTACCANTLLMQCCFASPLARSAKVVVDNNLSSTEAGNCGTELVLHLLLHHCVLVLADLLPLSFWPFGPWPRLVRASHGHGLCKVALKASRAITVLTKWARTFTTLPTPPWRAVCGSLRTVCSFGWMETSPILLPVARACEPPRLLLRSSSSHN